MESIQKFILDPSRLPNFVFLELIMLLGIEETYKSLIYVNKNLSKTLRGLDIQHLIINKIYLQDDIFLKRKIFKNFNLE